LRSLWGIELELIELVNEGALYFNNNEVRKIMDDARQWGSEGPRTDAQFLFTPPQIALACIFHFNEELVRKFLSLKFFPRTLLLPKSPSTTEDTNQEDMLEKLMSTIMQCDTLI
jgi:cyclin H